MTDCGTGLSRPIKFRCPIGLKNDYAAPDSWFETISGKGDRIDGHYLIYRPLPGEYSRMREGDPSRIKRRFKGYEMQIKLREAGFTLEIPTDDFRLRYLFEELAAICYTSAYTRYAPAIVLDYVEPGREAFKQAIAGNGDPHQIRYGSLEIEATSGSNGIKTSLYGVGGFRVVFRDVKQVLV